MWKDVPGYEGLYQVDECGLVRSLIYWNGHSYRKREVPFILQQSNTTTGYKKVDLSCNGKRKSFKVHRLVASAFIDNPEHKPHVNHIDGNPLNNHVSNLEWCTQQENVAHALNTGLKKIKPILKEELVRMKGEGYTVLEMENELHVSYRRLIDALDNFGIYHGHSKYHIPSDELKRMFDNGDSNREIAEHFNCPSSLIGRRRYQYKKGEF